MVPASDKVLAVLRRRIEAAELPAVDAESCSSGCVALDRLLPARGFRRGSLVEWCAASRGSGAATLALLAARQACRRGKVEMSRVGCQTPLSEESGDEVFFSQSPLTPALSSTTSNVTGRESDETARVLVVVDARGEFYPPAAAVWGINLERLLIVRPRRKADLLWAWDQALRCPAVGAVWGAVEKLDTRTFRRWQLAAEEGRGLGFLVRPADIRGQPSWADVRLLVRPVGRIDNPSYKTRHTRRLRVEVLRCRGGQAGACAEIEIDEMLGTAQQATKSEAVKFWLKRAE